MRKGTKYSIVMLLLGYFLYTGVAFAQVGGYGIPSTYDVIGEGVQSGDIISFNPGNSTYRLSQIPRDEDMFGVVDTSPVVVFRDGDINRVPIVQVGEVIVNVTTLNGPIAVGDSVTTSQIPGKGQKFERGEGYILGYALQNFDETSGSTTISYNGETLFIGPIRVQLNIGPSLSAFDEIINQSTIFVREEGDIETGLETIFRYVTAALFALGTVFVVLKTFGPNVGRGVISVGRNPLAKSSIQAMVIFNVILILSISIVAFIISLLIIFLPV
jgi:F0F1-type ATP synthase membrane subunit c/vacuolar-type H+-ATPase subunit K